MALFRWPTAAALLTTSAGCCSRHEANLDEDHLRRAPRSSSLDEGTIRTIVDGTQVTPVIHAVACTSATLDSRSA